MQGNQYFYSIYSSTSSAIRSPLHCSLTVLFTFSPKPASTPMMEDPPGGAFLPTGNSGYCPTPVRMAHTHLHVHRSRDSAGTNLHTSSKLLRQQTIDGKGGARSVVQCYSSWIALLRVKRGSSGQSPLQILNLFPLTYSHSGILRLDTERFLEDFEKWGPCARTCIGLAHGSLTEERLQDDAISIAKRFAQDPCAFTMDAPSKDPLRIRYSPSLRVMTQGLLSP